MISANFQQEVWNKLNSIERRLSFAGGGGSFAPFDAEYVVMSLSAVLPNERILTAGVGLDLVDGGAGGAATLNVDVGIADDDIVQIDMVGVADNDYAKFTANGLEGRNYAEVLSDLSGQALAAFDWNAQNLTNIGTIAAASGSTIGNLTLADGSITDSGGFISFGNENLRTTGNINFNSNLLSVGQVAYSVGIGRSTPSDSLHIYYNLTSVERGIKIETYLPSIKFLDISGSADDYQILVNLNNFYIKHDPDDDGVFENTRLMIDSSGYMYLYNIRSGATQAGAGASADELWKTASHATLPDNVVMIGV